MRFDNKDFESNVKTSLSTLDKLNQALKFKNSGSGFENLSKAAKGVNLDGIASGVAALEKRFSALGIVGMRVLENLTDTAMGFVNKTWHVLTDSIIQGGTRRAMNIENAHFQLQGLLKDEEKVQAVMQDAMDSVDGTAYAYDEAAKAASQFAASGMEAGEAMQSSLRAITGVAAMTNSDYESISRIFTTVAGNGRLMGDQLLQLSSRGLNAAASLKDFFNGVNNGSIQTRDEVTASIKALTKGLEVSEQDIRTWVTEGEISFAMFSSAMDDAFGEHAKKANETFTGAMSNVKASLARIGAEFVSPLIAQNGPLVQFFNALRERINDVKKNIGPLATMFTGSVTAMADAATKYLQALDLTKPMEVFYNIVDILKNVAKAVTSFLVPIGQAFRDVFPPMTAQRLTDITAAIRDFSEKLVPSEKTAALLQRTFRGLFAVLDIVKQAFMALGNVIKPLLGFLPGVGDGVLGVTAALGDGLFALDQWLEKSDVLGAVSEKVAGALSGLRDKLFGIFHSIESIFTGFDGIDLSGVDSFVDRLKERFRPIEGILENLRVVFYRVFVFFSRLSPIFQAIVRQIGNGFHALGAALTSAFGEADFDALLDLLNGGILAAIGVGLKKFVDGARGILSGIKKILNGVKGCLMAYQQDLKADILMKIALAIGVLTLSLLVLSTIDSDRLASATLAIGALLSELLVGFSIITKLTAGSTLKGVSHLSIAMTSLVGLAFAILTLATAMRIFGGMDDDALVKSVTAIGALLAELLLFTKFFTVNKGMMKGVTSLIVLAVALRMLVKPIQEIGSTDPEALVRGLIGLGALLAELAFFLKFADFDGMGVMKGLGLILMAEALKIMATAVAEIGSLDVNTLARGLTSIGAALLLIGGYSALLSGTKKMLSSAVSLLIISEALVVLARAIREVGVMEPETIVRGLLALASAMAAIAGAMRLMPKNTLVNAVALTVIATTLKLIAGVLADMGGLRMTEIGKGLLALGGSLLVIAIAVRVMSGALSGAAALLIVSAALAVLAPVLKTLGAMSLTQVGIALLALAGTFVVLGVAGLALTPIVPVLIALGAAVTLLGVGLAVGAAATMLFATALAALAVSGAAGAAALAGAIVTMAGTIPAVMKQIGEGIAELIKSIGNNASVIVEAFVRIARAVIQGCRELIPELVDGLLYLVEEVLLSLSVHAPQIVTHLMDFLIGVINALAEKLPELIVAAVNLIGAFFRGIVDALKGIDTTKLLEAIAGIGLLSLMMLALAAVASLVPAAMAGVLAAGAVIAEMSLVLAAVGALAQIPGLEWLINEGGDFLAAVGSAIGKFIGGIAGGVLEGATSALPKIGADLSAFMENAKGFINGAKQVDADMMAGVKALAETVLILTAADVLDGLTRWFTGGSSLTKFGEELSKFGPYIRQYAEDVAEVTPEAVEGSVNAAKLLSEMANKLPKHDGLKQWFTGDTTQAAVGKELAAFGPHLAAYVNSVSGLTAEGIANSVAAVQGLSDIITIADAIPNSGGVIGFFAGNNDLGTFGENLANLGAALSRYSSSLANVSLELVKKGTDALGELIDLAQGMKNVSFSQMSSFSHHLKLLADGGVEKFIQAFSDAKPKMKSAVVDFLSEASNAMKGKKEELRRAAEEAMNSLELGITGKREAILRTVTAVCNAIKDETARGLQDAYFLESGRRIVSALSRGMAQMANLPVSTIKSILQKAADAAAQYTEAFERAGQNVISGLNNGITSGSGSIASAAANVGRSLLSSLNQALGINSPSKEGEKIGAFTDEGIIAGLLGRAKDVTSAGSAVGNSLTTALGDSLAGLSEDMLADPVIRPVVDLSEVERSAGMIGGLFGTQQTLALAGNVSAGMDRYTTQRNQNDLGSMLAGLKSEVAELRETVGALRRSTDIRSENGTLAGSVGSAVRDALSGVSVTMDGQRVGRLVTDYQNSTTRRRGNPTTIR